MSAPHLFTMFTENRTRAPLPKTMYRELLLLLLCAGVVVSAPQQDSNITYVQRPAKLDEPRPNASSTQEESKIEIVPLTIPSTIDTKNTNENTKSTTPKTAEKPVYNYSDRIYSIKTKPKTTSSTTETTLTPTPTDKVAREVNVNNTDVIVLEIKDTDITPAESLLQDTVANENQSSTYEDVTESSELVTEKYEETIATTEVDVETTRAPLPNFIPKLSYFQKSSYGSFSQNLIASPGKRRFRSRCRCEKIWNCVKLQISVPRCPEEYFLCCS
ncbi:unnamed protein product [Chrysodeixis includens]|uniref:Uncharacterized protein n=1 Tax=Chrysodeixis includens TaxID=689277 RepID=A0A9P0BYB5_CHRIL|nr:unnamed protein product [Chrysodeixis includens]